MKLVTLLFVVGVAGPAAAELSPADVEFFEKKIRPVLAEHCYECHNSTGKNKGGLALDFKAALFAGGDSGDVVVPGKPDQSVLIRSIRHDNDLKMPSKAPKLDDVVIRDFERWIEMGAPDPRLTKPSKDDLKVDIPWPQQRSQRAKWWSFQPVRDHAPPEVSDPQWANSAIDRFVYDRMQREGIKPQPIASAEVLVRRVHLVLTGLPPTPEAVRAFVSDPSPQAYEQLVNKLLASKAYGERWARHWMDWYRYAETHGSEGDPPIAYIQQYRDYLVRALNADVPYDQLLREHLAGDLLKKPRINNETQINESAIGPAHLRMVPHGFGVTDAYGEQITFIDNQIDVISKAMLGVTVSCARCHDHKFDPISQKDFYRFYGIMVSNRPSSVLIDAPRKLQTSKAEIVALKQQMRRGLAEHWLGQVGGMPDWLDKQAKQIANRGDVSDPFGAWNLLRAAKPADYANRIKGQFEQLQKLADARVQAIKNAESYVDLRDPANRDKWFTTGNSSADRVSPAGSFALHAGGDRVVRGIYPRGIYSHLISDKHAAVFSSGNFMAKGKQGVVRAMGIGAQVRAPIRNYPLTHGGLHPTANVKNESYVWVTGTRKWRYWQGEQIHFELRTGRDVIPRPSAADRTWFGVSEIFIGDQPPKPEGASLLKLVADPGTIRDRESLSRAYTETLRRVVASWRNGRMTDAEAEFLDAFIRAGFLTNQVSLMPDPIKQQVARYRELDGAIPVPTRAPGVIDAEPVDHPLLTRGEYKQEADPVRRQFLEIFSERAYPADASGRLQLAEDMVSDANTLKSRVLINRLWAYVYGRGLAASTDNLGRLGSKPTHPELLDHLCIDFEKHGWSIKRVLRQMVTSRAFRSASQADAATLQNDPLNLYLSHFTPRRLDAEAIYDSLQHVAGRTDRAIYKPVIRNRLDPFLAAFNAPVPTSTVSFRNSTNVPAQALTMMNGAIAERAARDWAQRIERDKSLTTHEQRIAAMVMQAYGRAPSASETRLLFSYLTGQPVADTTLADLAAERDEVRRALAEARRSGDVLLDPVRARLQREVDQRNAAAAKDPANKPVDLKPIARWDFERDASDAIGKLHGTANGQAKIEDGALVLNGGFVATGPIDRAIDAKTLEVLVQLDPITQRGGGAMTLQTLGGKVFDSIVFAEQAPAQWLAGSDNFRRTVPFGGAVEGEALKRPVRMIYVYEADGTIRAYRDGKPYGKAIKKSDLIRYKAGGSQVVFGLRHGISAGGKRMLTGRLYEARLYDRALSAEEVAAASSGQLKETVTRKMLHAALSGDKKKQLERLDSQIAELEIAERELSHRLTAEQNRNPIKGGGYFGIAHALLNSKEFTYVH